MSGKMEANSWLPLHFIIMGSGFAVIMDLILLPRLISLLFGILTIVVVGLLTNQLFKKKEITIYAVLITLVIPQRIILSSVPLPEIIFIFFIVLTSLLINKYIHFNKIQYLVYAAVLLSVSNALRYEGWFISAAVGIYVLFGVKGLRKQLPVILLLSSFPLFWLMFNYLKHGDFLYFLNEPGIYYDLVREDTIFNRFKLNPILQFVEQNLITFNFIGFAGVYLLWNKHHIRKWLGVVFTPLILLSAISLFGMRLPAHNFWRTSAVWVILLVPFTSYVIYRIRNSFAESLTAKMILVLFPIIMLYSNTHYIETAAKYSLNENNITAAREIIKFMDNNTDKKERILIEHVAHFEHFEIVVSSREPFRFIYSKRNELTPIKEEEYSGIIINYYLVKSLGMKQKLNNGKYIKVLEKDGWELYTRKSAVSAESGEVKINF